MSEILDNEELLEEFEDDRESVEHLLQIFERDCNERLPKIHDAIQRGDPRVLQEEAHSIKGSAGNFFAIAAFSTAQTLETMGANGDCGGAMGYYEQLRTDIEALKDAVKGLLNSL